MKKTYTKSDAERYHSIPFLNCRTHYQALQVISNNYVYIFLCLSQVFIVFKISYVTPYSLSGLSWE